MDVGLETETFHHSLSQLWNVRIAHLQLEAASLSTGGIQKVADQPIQAVAFLLDDSQALPHRFFIPLGIFTAQGTGITLDNRNGGLQFMGDHRNESGLDLLRLAKARDVVYVGNDTDEPFLFVIEG